MGRYARSFESIFAVGVAATLMGCSPDFKVVAYDSGDPMAISVFSGKRLEPNHGAASGAINQPADPLSGAHGAIGQPSSPLAGATGSVGQPADAPAGATGSVGQPAGVPTVAGAGAGGTVSQPPGMTVGAGATLDQPTSQGTAGGTGIPSTQTAGGPQLASATNDLLAAIGSPQGVSVRLMCGSHIISSPNGLLKHRIVDPSVPMVLKVNGSVCSSDSSAILNQIMGARNLKVRDLCPTLASGPIQSLELLVDGVFNSGVNSGSDGLGEVLGMTLGGILGGGVPRFTVIYASNLPAGGYNTPAYAGVDDNCESSADPLIVHMKGQPERLSLTPQSGGLWFDILGASNNYEKVRISWFTNQSYGLLALPDSAGRVTGIDQLFGDRTLGPDGQFADDGYAALSKYDSNADGRIDQRDPVYGRLRVWVDRNYDGIASANELLSLPQADIRYILTTYTTDFSETDQYGNTANRKSYIGRFDGSRDLIFDLWFAY